MRKRVAVLAVLVALAVAAPAHANAGTAMMWLGMLHLLFGNLFVGLLEWGVLYALLRRDRQGRGVGSVILIGANYVSAFVGFALLVWVWPGVASQAFPQPLLQAKAIIALSWALLFVLTVLIEWPFVLWAANCSSTRHWGQWRALGACLALNVVSYAVLVPLYYQVSPVTLVTQTSVASAPEIAGSLKARVYYLDRLGNVWEMRADGTQAGQVARADLSSDSAELFLVANPKTGRLDLYGDPRMPDEHAVCLLRGVGKTPRFPDATGNTPAPPVRPLYDGTNQSNWQAMDLRPVGQADDSVGLGTWAAEGVMYGQKPHRRRLALETPFLALTPRHGTALPGDVVVLQYTSMFGGARDQIALLDLPDRRLAVLADGRSPVVVLDELPTGATWWQPKPTDTYEESFLKFRVRGNP